MDAGAPAQLVEFRSYRIVPDGVDAFVEHFEERFLASQEMLGMDIVGQFRVIDDAERFVWIRRYLDPSTRATSLAQFYTGPVWEEFGPRANELIVDHTDVHLLRPDISRPDFAANHLPHAKREGALVEAASTVLAAFYELDGTRGISAAIAETMTETIKQATGTTELGRLVAAAVANDFPPLPVHEDIIVGLWLMADSHDGREATAIAAAVARQHRLPLRAIQMVPTTRSTLR